MVAIAEFEYNQLKAKLPFRVAGAAEFAERDFHPGWPFFFRLYKIDLFRQGMHSCTDSQSTTVFTPRRVLHVQSLVLEPTSGGSKHVSRSRARAGQNFS